MKEMKDMSALELLNLLETLKKAVDDNIREFSKEIKIEKPFLLLNKQLKQYIWYAQISDGIEKIVHVNDMNQAFLFCESDDMEYADKIIANNPNKFSRVFVSRTTEIKNVEI